MLRVGVPFQFDLSLIPAEEHKLARAIMDNLEALDRYVKQFGEALSLFDYVEHMRHRSPPPPPAFLQLSSGWSFVAARDGAMTIYHFLCAMEGAKACVHRSPTIKEKALNAKRSREATKLFSSKFPRCEAMRHAVAHEAELVQSPEKLEENAFRGTFAHGALSLPDVEIGMVTNSLIGRTYFNTINGEVIGYDISHESLKALAEIRDMFFSAFTH